MTHWKLTLAYDGTPFHGWQIQPGIPTVQGTLAAAIHRIAREHVLPQGSGRTDTGVHALGQVASFPLASPIPAGNLHRALNHVLPPSIRVLSAQVVPDTFHARHSARRKTYQYRIFPLRAQAPENAPPHPPPSAWEEQPHPSAERICPPTLAPFVWPCRWPLSLAALNSAGAHVIGTHDFTSFAASSDPDEPDTPSLGSDPPHESCEAPTAPPRPRTAIRTIFESHWREEEGLLLYTVSGSGFLHHMVRNLVGTFVQAGSGRLSPGAIPAILNARNRSAGGPTAPASGLFLISVHYPGYESPATTN